MHPGPARHKDLIRQIRQAGARVKLITDGDVAGAIGRPRGHRVDMLVGIGGTPEAVIAACALKCLDGAMYGRLWPRNDDERQAALDAGYDLDKVLDIDDLVRGRQRLLRGHRGHRRRAAPRGPLRPPRRHHQSLSMRSKSGTSRQIDARHQLSKLSRYASIDYGFKRTGPLEWPAGRYLAPVTQSTWLSRRTRPPASVNGAQAAVALAQTRSWTSGAGRRPGR